MYVMTEALRYFCVMRMILACLTVPDTLGSRGLTFNLQTPRIRTVVTISEYY